MKKRTFLQAVSSVLTALGLSKKAVQSEVSVKPVLEPSHKDPYETLNTYFSAETPRLYDDLLRHIDSRGTITKLMEKGPIPEGVGYNYQKLSSVKLPSATWKDLGEREGSVTEVAPFNVVHHEFSAQQCMIKSEVICFADASRGYGFEKNVSCITQNFVDCLFQAWEDEAFLNYKKLCKVFHDEGTVIQVLDRLYSHLVMEGAAETVLLETEDSYPVFVCFADMETITFLSQAGASAVKPLKNIKFKKGFEWLEARLACVENLRPNGILSVSGFVFIPKELLSRYSIDGTEVFAHSNEAGKISVNKSYQDAPIGEIIVWNTKVFKALLNKELVSGIGTKISWQNIKCSDVNSPDFNPLGMQGRFWASSMVAWEPGITQWGKVVRFTRQIS